MRIAGFTGVGNYNLISFISKTVNKLVVTVVIYYTVSSVIELGGL